MNIFETREHLLNVTNTFLKGSNIFNKLHKCTVNVLKNISKLFFEVYVFRKF